MKKLWEFLNSPIFDIIGGFCIQVLDALLLYFLRFYLDIPYIYLCYWILGFVFAISLDCLHHGFERLRSRKNSSIGDDNEISCH